MIEIPLAGGRGVALVDNEDAALVNERRWHLGGHGYAYTRRLRSDPPEWPKQVSMHHLILGLCSMRGHKTVVDHRNHDRLDNRRPNLRVTNHAGNGAHRSGLNRNNTSGFSGVHWREDKRLWCARAGGGATRACVGYFKTAEAAARARWEWIVAHNLQDFYARHVPRA